MLNNFEIFLKKYFAPLRILNLSIKSFVNPFIDIALTLFDGLLSNSVFLAKLAISLLLAKFAGLRLKWTFYDINLLNSGVAMYLSWFGPVTFFLI